MRNKVFGMTDDKMSVSGNVHGEGQKLKAGQWPLNTAVAAKKQLKAWLQLSNSDQPRDRLQAEVDLELDAQPFSRDGFLWAKRPQHWWVSRLAVSVETLRRLISKPPFVRKTITDPDTGHKVTLLRIGTPGPRTKKDVQNILAAIWRKKTGLAIRGAQYGHLGGLVDAWGLEKASVIFAMVLDDVPAFMAGAKLQIDALGDEGYLRYYNKFPPTGFILRFHQAGADMYLMKEQATKGLQGDFAGLSYSA
jgi:hypothetical protein